MTGIRTPVLLLLAVLVLAPSARAQPAGPLQATDLRSDWAKDPLGIDSGPLRLSWTLEGSGRGRRQTAWEVLAASSAEGLAAGRGDMWDSGKVSSDEEMALYRGRYLHSAEQVFWKVRVWDERGRRSAWSSPATWTTGLLSPEDWIGRWITKAELRQWVRADYGYRSRYVGDPRTEVWVQVDLGSERSIDEVRLYALRYGVTERMGFPVRFRVEASDDSNFAEGTAVADYTAVDYPNPWVNEIDLPASSVRGRYVRLTATRLRVTDGVACLALSQMAVMSGGRNVAAGAPVSASDSVEDDPWRAAALTDGLGIPGSNPKADATLLLRREFTVRPGLRRALAFVSGLGQYELSLNGRKAGEDLLSPSWLQYGKASPYDTRDITALLQPGRNAAGLRVGGGMYNVQQTPGRYNKFVTPYRPPVALAQIRLEYADGSVETIATDASWKAALGPTTYADLYGGEDYDARREPEGWDRPGFEDSGWEAAAPVEGPGGVMRGASEMDPPVREVGSLAPASSRVIRPGVVVYDLGQNADIMPRIRVQGPAGGTVRIIPAELLHPDGTVDRRSEGGSLAYWQYTLAGRAGGESWFPRFFSSGARYLQVETTAPAGGDRPVVGSLKGALVASDSPSAGDFACSSDLFNRIHTLVWWAQRNNLMHVITDCPHRERLGWLEQVHLDGPALRYDFDLRRLFAKGLDDMEDAQEADGLVPEIAPEYTIFGGDFHDSPEWGSALILAAWQQYQWTGDETVLRRHYAAMQRYVAYLEGKARDHLLTSGLGDWYDQGPNRPGPAQLTPVALTATAFLQADLATMANIAERLRQYGVVRHYREQADVVRDAFNRAFFDGSAGRYGSGSQTAQALPLVLGLPNETDRSSVFNALVRDVEDRGYRFTAGDIGYRYVLRALADGGRSDLIAAATQRTDVPGYGYQLARGCTSLAEAWDADPRSSQDHLMLGEIVEWFYHDLVGLAPASPGFERILVKPQPVPQISWARARYLSPRGPVAVSWKKAGPRLILQVDIPPNSVGEIHWPYIGWTEVTEEGRPAERRPGVHYLRREEEHAVYEVESGHYEFEGLIGATR